MKHVLALAAFWKKADVIFQCALFLMMLVTIGYTAMGLFGCYVMAIGQFVSALIWLLVLNNDIPKLKSANVIRIAIIITMVILGLIVIIDQRLFFAASIGMLLLGPLLGISYFVITLLECRFYSRVRKPYYLL